MDRLVTPFGKKSLNSQRPRTDRFVAPRSSLDELRRRRSCGDDEPAGDIWQGKVVRQRKFAGRLNQAFGLASPRPQRGWPCVPRQRAHLSSADNVLDLPTYSIAEFPELLDWSKDDILVAALGDQYYKWSWHSQRPVATGFTRYNTACCRFDPAGERLALGTESRRVEVHNSWSKWMATGWCGCDARVPAPTCLVTALDWSPTGNSFVIGCSRGLITAFDRDAHLMGGKKATVNPIFLVKISPDARYVAVASVHSSLVRVLLWPSLSDVREVCSEWIVKTIAWHPWRSALLGIGGVADAQSWVALYDAPRATVLLATSISKNAFSVDTMMFSQRTGELVLSLWNTAPEPRMGSSRLVVMSGPQVVVDQWGEGRQGMDRIRTMVFNPDGTKLAPEPRMDSSRLVVMSGPQVVVDQWGEGRQAMDPIRTMVFNHCVMSNFV